MSFEKAIKHALVDKGMNVSDLAREIGHSPQYIHNILKGRRRLNTDIMFKICDVLDLEVKILPKSKTG
ncbi:DNA binding protein [Paenibacillus phage Wanderer]|uniref:Helix-turn-helix domain Cro/C1-type transcriptional regulator n=2 Tax=Wanderervirus wanderer TaxID=2845749 RepID=A0A345ARJ3_9CAUD|nr:DNA binding protein [Paenibacillus phage Wanderer]AXF39447.1 helix-turn-helix domain Cro/C1-type transcriptional regulator [Paenibacillus phage Wanderer]AXF40330.1 helix-turn-helix domain XRE family transcriptional regulator [Paenibacillus phage LincolnB]